jgi:hypothetical protein
MLVSMMGFLRIVSVVLISFAMPVVATASITTPGLAGCPMPSSEDHPASMNAVPDCCGHGSTDQAPFQGCKAGQGCKACSAYAVIPAGSAMDSFPGAALVAVRFSDLAFSSHDPRGLWRPPRSL